MTYLFDFDGTLVDSMQQWSEKMLRILRDSGVSYPDDIIKIITPLGDNGTAEYFIRLGVPMTKQEMFDLMDYYAIKEYTYNIPAKPYVSETLHALKKAGHSLNVLTASPHKMLDVCLKRLELYDLFDNVWSCDDFGTTKSNPEIYIRAAEKMGCKVSECIFLDDNYGAVKTAKEAGMQTVAVYDDTSRDMEQEMRALADRYIFDFRELI
ncbi:MAG: HAD family phosphatase [Clostridia bacterium]|nr:HAD family phosphatase [Clostridia bacterium]